MAKFNYRMQNILNIKEKLETQAKNEYGIATQKLHQEQEILQNLLIRRNKYERRLKELMQDTLDIREITNARNDVNTIKTLVRRQLAEVKKAEIAVEQARNLLSERMIDRKTHETLKDHAFDEFKAELQASESKEIDELVSYTFNSK